MLRQLIRTGTGHLQTVSTGARWRGFIRRVRFTLFHYLSGIQRATGLPVVVNGEVYPAPHPDYGHHAEELFHYTSRYYGYTEAFLRAKSGQAEFCMAEYHAHHLSPRQRRVLAGLLAAPAGKTVVHEIAQLVTTVCRGSESVDGRLYDFYSARVPQRVTGKRCRGAPVECHGRRSSLDPLLHLAGRYQIPVEVVGREVRMSLRTLVPFLDSPVPVMRRNIQRCISALHGGGYVLHNIPPRRRPTPLERILRV